MPNFVNNKLVITGPKSDRENFLDKYMRTETGKLMDEIDLNKILPCPSFEYFKNKISHFEVCETVEIFDDEKPILHKNSKKYNEKLERIASKYQNYWRCNNWGTESIPFNLCMLSNNSKKTKLLYYTVCSVVNKNIFIKMFEEFPTLDWKVLYAESGFECVGYTDKTGNYQTNLTEEDFVRRGGYNTDGDSDDGSDYVENILVEKYAKYQELYNYDVCEIMDRHGK